MQTVTVQHGLGKYPVRIGAGAIAQLTELTTRQLPNRRIAIITDTTVQRHYDDWLSAPEHLWRYESDPSSDRTAAGRVFAVAPGEVSKTREAWARLIDALLEGGFGRDSAIVALGGGVVGDLAGFVAATFMRGVPLLAVPTTLVAMVDASVGGKTAINTPQGKNLIGAFHPPIAVLADPCTLLTLPDPVFRSGLAEAVKHGVVADREYFEWIGREAGRIRTRDLETLARLVKRSVELKAAIVSRDEREAGERAVLNAGHTLGHGLEHASGYRIDHGEAVALGLLAECRLAEAMGVAEAGLADAVEQVLTMVNLPTTLRMSVDADAVIRAIQADKKSRSEVPHLALPESIGHMHHADDQWTIEVPSVSLIREALGTITLPER
ncbi:MAG TPA: 3-dehydroquinate synthase [Gemmatimonadales bacterium]|nr:3-dehydroquinate synthase [Gemmatimonadales bacterium]